MYTCTYVCCMYVQYIHTYKCMYAVCMYVCMYVCHIYVSMEVSVVSIAYNECNGSDELTGFFK